MSRIQTPLTVAKHWKQPRVRKAIIKDLTKVTAVGLSALGLAHLAGAEVGLDPRSPDFGKIKIGNIIYNNPDVQLVEGFKTANVGYQILKDLKTTIDQNNNLIKFERSISITENKMFTEPWEVENDFTGFYAKGERKIFIEDGEMYLRRGNAPKLKLVKLKDDEYEMVFNKPVNNELPIIRFERDENGKVRGLAFLFKDGREEFVEKDVE